MTKESQNIADVRFICDELLRFRHMSPEQLTSQIKGDLENIVAHLNHPKYGILFCGPAAYDRFEELAKRTIKPRSVEAKSFHMADYVRTLREAFVELFIDRGEVVNQRSVAKLISYGKRLATKKLVQVVHHLPCTLFVENEPNQFTVGPVTFTCVERFFEKCRKSIKANSLADRLMPNIRHYYSAYGWVASVNIGPCHHAVSRTRAEQAVDAALDVLRVLVPSYSQRYKRADSSSIPNKCFELATNQAGELEVTLRFQSKGALVSKNWHAWMLSEGSRFWHTFGQAISPLVRDERVDNLNQRLVDALNWFGQAVVEHSPAAKVVKYTAALERLTVTGHVEVGKIEKLIIQRVALLNQDRTDKPQEAIRKEIGNLYQYRSDLMHGTRSPYDRSVTRVLGSAWEITRWSILNAAQLFTLIRETGEPTRQRLAKVYDGGWKHTSLKTANA